MSRPGLTVAIDYATPGRLTRLDSVNQSMLDRISLDPVGICRSVNCLVIQPAMLTSWACPQHDSASRQAHRRAVDPGSCAPGCAAPAAPKSDLHLPLRGIELCSVAPPRRRTSRSLWLWHLLPAGARRRPLDHSVLARSRGSLGSSRRQGVTPGSPCPRHPGGADAV